MHALAEEVEALAGPRAAALAEKLDAHLAGTELALSGLNTLVERLHAAREQAERERDEAREKLATPCPGGCGGVAGPGYCPGCKEGARILDDNSRRLAEHRGQAQGLKDAADAAQARAASEHLVREHPVASNELSKLAIALLAISEEVER